jgi:hypothetical protein
MTWKPPTPGKKRRTSSCGLVVSDWAKHQAERIRGKTPDKALRIYNLTHFKVVALGKKMVLLSLKGYLMVNGSLGLILSTELCYIILVMSIWCWTM